MSAAGEIPVSAAPAGAVADQAVSRIDSTGVARLVLVLAAVASALMLWSRRDYIPIWDGRIYSDCIVAASRNLLDVGGYRCAGHVSQSYVALLVLAQALDIGSPLPVLAMNALLLAAGAIGLMRVLLAIFPGDEHRIGRALLVAAFVLHPVVLASAVQPGIDFGVLIFAICTLAAMLERRRWAMVMFGVLLVFSKETGVLVYAVIGLVALWRDGLRRVIPNGGYWFGIVAVGTFGVLNVVNSNFLSLLPCALVLAVLLLRLRRPERVPVQAVWRAALREWTIAVPLIIVFGYMATNALRLKFAAHSAGAPPVLWKNERGTGLLEIFFRPSIIDQSTLAALALMLVVGFMWVPTVLSVVDAAFGVDRRARSLPPRALRGGDADALALVTAMLAGEIWLLSRFVTYANARYFLPVYPLLLVTGYGALVRFGTAPRVRSAILAALALLFGVSALYTVDPVSRKLWGVFTPGDRSMLYVTSITGECCGAGRDQLVYNLEFTRFDDLTSDATEAIRADGSTTIVLPMLGNWHNIDQIDTTTRRRTLATTGSVKPKVLTALEALRPKGRVSAAWYFELPYLDNMPWLNELNEVYQVGAPLLVIRDGYTMKVRKMRLRTVPLGSPGNTGPNAANTGGAPR
jgi:hypothetical protein